VYSGANLAKLMVFKEGKYTGTVEPGQGVAFRDYDIPTANLTFDEDVQLETGVYAAITTWKEQEYESILCYGVGDPPKFEVHIFDFDEDIYGEKLEVGIIEKVSELIPWQSKERMRQKIIHDIGLVKDIFKK
jgi:riboflavin kinase/FMN adenylyltransferase